MDYIEDDFTDALIDAICGEITIKTSQCRSIAYNHGQDNLVRRTYNYNQQ